MFIDRLINETPTQVLEQQLNFTETRQQLLADNIANVDTPGYQQKDLSLDSFQAMLRQKVAMADSSPDGSVSFEDVHAEVENPANGILFHDGNNRSMEQLMTDNAKNALMHNLVVELLRSQYQSLSEALKEKVS
jgi:flagellar basal-body rod protein FlgB